jgi:hypothetical protein
MHSLESHTVLLWTGYGPAGYALFVAVYAGLEVCILSSSLTIVLNVSSLINLLQRFIQNPFLMACERDLASLALLLRKTLLWWDYNWIIVQVCAHPHVLIKKEEEDISSTIYLCEHMIIFILWVYVFWILHPHDCFVQQ